VFLVPQAEAKQQVAKACKVNMVMEAKVCNIQEALRQPAQQVMLMVVAEVLDFGAGRAEVTPDAVQEEEQAVLATLVAASPQPLPLQKQARLALLQAKPQLTAASTPLTSKA